MKSIKELKDKTGIVFDIYEWDVDRFEDVYHDLIQRRRGIKFEVRRCKTLPELDVELEEAGKKPDT